jgi:hypothetical protein
LADELSEFYFGSRQLTKEDLHEDVFLWRDEDSVNRRMQSEYDRLVDEFVDDLDPAEVISEMAKNSGWGNADIDLLNTLNKDQIIEMLDRLQGEKLMSILSL